MMKVVERFSSIQGEGLYAACRSYFVRLGRCNLSCSGCDTKFDAWNEVPEEEVAASFEASRLKHLVVTGGEPCLWQAEVAKLVSLVGAVVTVETNGTVPIKDFFVNLPRLFSFSPKVGSLGSDQKFKWDVVLENLSKVGYSSSGMQLKYVVDGRCESDLERVYRFHSMVERVVKIEDHRVFFQPLDKGTLVNVKARVSPFDPVAYCDELAALHQATSKVFGQRFRVVPQLHKLLQAGGGLAEEVKSGKLIGEAASSGS